ncbi:MAG: alpha/beta fold hydrolase [Bacteroidales bacterium]|nr:alpha/beta fold hydrolase [Bacteroidales bacterium]
MNKKAKGWIIAAAVLAVLVAAVFGLKAWIGSSSPRGVINPIKGPVIHVEELSFFKGLDKISGKVYKPQDTLSRKPVLICCSGLGTPLSAWDDVCRTMAKKGIIAYAFDFRGGCPGSPSAGKTTTMTLSSEKEDLTIVLRHILKEDFTDRDKVFFIGHSQGGLIAAQVAAASRKDVAGMILLAPAFNIPDMVNSLFPSRRDIPDSTMLVNMYVGKKYLLEARTMDTYRKLDRYKNPVLILQGKDDTIVPPEYSELAAQEFPSCELILLDGVAHSFEGSFKNKYIIDFIDRQLSK